MTIQRAADALVLSGRHGVVTFTRADLEALARLAAEDATLRPMVQGLAALFDRVACPDGCVGGHDDPPGSTAS